MKILLKTLALSSVLALTACQSMHHEKGMHKDGHHGKHSKMHRANVVEIATFKLKDGVSYDDFAKLDRAVAKEHVSKQPGFVKRHSARGQNGEWLAVVYWKDMASAQASMNSFVKAPAAAAFMQNMDTSTMKMTRYELNKKMQKKH